MCRHLALFVALALFPSHAVGQESSCAVEVGRYYMAVPLQLAPAFYVTQPHSSHPVLEVDKAGLTCSISTRQKLSFLTSQTPFAIGAEVVADILALIEHAEDEGLEHDYQMPFVAWSLGAHSHRIGWHQTVGGETVFSSRTLLDQRSGYVLVGACVTKEGASIPFESVIAIMGSVHEQPIPEVPPCPSQ